MSYKIKTYFQDVHYNRKKPNFFLESVLSLSEFFYKNIILFKNYLYKKNILKENKTNAYVICVGNLTTGGVGKTPIVIELANKISKIKKTAIISRGYGAKLQNKNPNIIKDYDGIKFKNGVLCGDEPYQIAKKTSDNTIVITCSDRLKASNLAVEKYNTEVVILDDGFSNRKIKKDETIIVVDSKMLFGNKKLLPAGPLREPVDRINDADKIIIVNKGDNDIDLSINYLREFNKPISICTMIPKRIYNIQTKAEIKITKKADIIAFCAIGQPLQFYDYVKRFYNLSETLSFEDHHKYSQNDIQTLIKLAKKYKITSFITTQKDEAKLKSLISNISDYSFNVLELQNIIEELKN